MKKSGHRLQISYSVISFLVPLIPAAVFAALIVSLDDSSSKLALNARGKLLIPALAVATLGILIGAVVLGVLNIIEGHKKYAECDEQFCTDAMLIEKYCMIPFFTLNIVSVLINHAVMLVAGHGITLLLLPITVPICVAVTYLYMIPGAFWGMHTIRLLKNRGVFSDNVATVLCIMQFVFVIDIVSAAVISVKYTRRARTVSLIVLVLMALLTATTLAAAVYGASKLFAAV